MALTMVADSAFIVPIMFWAASRISERMARLRLSCGYHHLHGLFAVHCEHTVDCPAVAATGKCLGGIARKIVRKKQLFSFLGLYFMDYFINYVRNHFIRVLFILNSAASALNFRLCGAAGNLEASLRKASEGPRLK